MSKILKICKNLSYSDFHLKSYAFIPSLFDNEICAEARNYIIENESSIIDKYSKDTRGMVVEKVHGRNLIKYFEYPLHLNAKLFGKFLTSKISTIAEFLLGEEVHFVSAEIHSRFGLATEIPPHQDNAYYGLEGGQALTFYISLDNQTSDIGGLQYISNPSSVDLPHITSNSSGFSLRLADESFIGNIPAFSPSYSPGDCTIHHSRSIHRASPACIESPRCLVVRFSFYSCSAQKRDGHDAWYRSMIEINRLNS